MRIQHNIMAMNAYRNYTNNVSAMKKNLEKLSSGYKINRAGDDAAGLAISEKMRAQITGLQTAQKNAKDGISLIQTAEGALTEVHDMLNRMVTLATQSANGTYDNETDRVQLQKEVDQLREEINRIADSSNFNGIKLLDGTLGLNTDAFEMTLHNATDATPVSGVFGTLPNAGSTKVTNTILHEDGENGQKGEFTLDFSQVVKKADGAAIAKVDVTIGGKTITVAATDKNTDLDGKTIASKLMTALGGGIVVKAADGTVDVQDSYTVAAGDLFYTATNNNDGTITFKATDYGSSATTPAKVAFSTDADLAKIGDNTAGTLNWDFSIATNTGGGDLIGTENVANTKITSTIKRTDPKLANTVVAFDVTKLEDGMEITLGDKTVKVKLGKDSTVTGSNLLDLSDFEAADLSSNKAEVLDRVTVALSSNGYFTVGQTSDNKLSLSEIADGEGASALTTDKQEKLTTVDKIAALMSVTKPASNAITDIKITSGNLVEGNTLTIGDKQYTFVKDTSATAPSGTVYVDINNAVNDLASKLSSNGVTASANGNTVSITAQSATDDPPVVLGKGLTLQIGDTADSFNQLVVKVNDTHCSSLGIADINIANQDGAAAAVDKIKSAINFVSDVRGTLGATQNRLDHTINNLSVMTENIQDAESTIRDTDVAEEMMAYTKNNILIQSAQAMLAQANQVPQGVLQLLQ